MSIASAMEGSAPQERRRATPDERPQEKPNYAEIGKQKFTQKTSWLKSAREAVANAGYATLGAASVGIDKLRPSNISEGFKNWRKAHAEKVSEKREARAEKFQKGYEKFQNRVQGAQDSVMSFVDKAKIDVRFITALTELNQNQANQQSEIAPKYQAVREQIRQAEASQNFKEVARLSGEAESLKVQLAEETRAKIDNYSDMIAKLKRERDMLKAIAGTKPEPIGASQAI